MNELRKRVPAKAKVLKPCKVDGKPVKAGEVIETCADTVRNLERKGLLAPA